MNWQDKFFGWTRATDPLKWKRSTYNSIWWGIGCAVYAPTFHEFLGLVLMGEAILVSIEGCWPKGADDESE